MNPILIKPKGNMVSQIVMHGKPCIDVSASNYYSDFVRSEGIRCIRESLKRLETNFDIIVLEGAGSPAEINLYEREIANMRVADIADASVIVVGDIDRGGVFASIVGTLQLLKPQHRKRVKGLIINKFRGDLELLKPGLVTLERITGKAILGVIPFIEELHLPSEDSVSLEDKARKHHIDIAVIHFPRISNFTDFEPLDAIHNVQVRYVRSESELGEPDAIILPGTKNTVQDLLWLRKTNLASKIVSMAKSIPIIGICGGFQILGRRIIDSNGLEGEINGEFKGLGLLDVITYFERYEKVTEQVLAESLPSAPIFGVIGNNRIKGYEIHMGRTVANDGVKPVFKIVQRSKRAARVFDGAYSKNGIIMGTYMHGLFENEIARDAFVKFLEGRAGKPAPYNKKDSEQIWEESIDRLAGVVARNLDMKKLFEIIVLPN